MPLYGRRSANNEQRTAGGKGSFLKGIALSPSRFARFPPSTNNLNCAALFSGTIPNSQKRCR